MVPAIPYLGIHVDTILLYQEIKKSQLERPVPPHWYRRTFRFSLGRVLWSYQLFQCIGGTGLFFFGRFFYCADRAGSDEEPDQTSAIDFGFNGNGRYLPDIPF